MIEKYRWIVCNSIKTTVQKQPSQAACQLLITAAARRHIDPTRGSIAILSLICNVPSPHAEGISHNPLLATAQCLVSRLCHTWHVSNATCSRRGLAHDADGDFLVNGMYLWSRVDACAICAFCQNKNVKIFPCVMFNIEITVWINQQFIDWYCRCHGEYSETDKRSAILYCFRRYLKFYSNTVDKSFIGVMKWSECR